jgi:glycosyltransferase involved in cell wall biosynthesis
MDAGQSRPFVSVIIPVYNDAQRLRTCLGALEQQTYPKDSYEVLVIDNGSKDSIEPVVAPFKQAVALVESIPGSFAARNKGISIAKGSVLAFTDADCIPSPQWIEKGVEELGSNPGCGMVAGRIDLFFKDPAHPTSAELYDVVMIGLPQKQFVEEYHFGATANVFTTPCVFDRVGLFDATLKSGGDNDWGRRVFAAGLPVLYGDEAIVMHPARDSLREMIRKIVRVTGGHFDSKTKRGYPLTEFAIDVARQLLGFRVFFENWNDPHLKGAGRKLRFYALVFAIKYARAYELLRLRFGGRSIRG